MQNFFTEMYGCSGLLQNTASLSLSPVCYAIVKIRCFGDPHPKIIFFLSRAVLHVVDFFTCCLFKVIVSRNYRGDVEMSCIERFMPLLVEKEDEGIHSPVIQAGDISYTYIKHMNLYRMFAISQVFHYSHSLLTVLNVFSRKYIKKEYECSSCALVSI